MNRYLTSLLMLIPFCLLLGCQEKPKMLIVDKPEKQTLKAGDEVEVTVEITRKNFANPVYLEIEGLPSGVTVEEDRYVIGSDASSATFTLEAASTAEPVDDHLALVTASTEDLPTVSQPLYVTITQ